MKAKILAGLFALAFLVACGSSNQPAESADTLAVDSTVVVPVVTNAVDTTAVDSSAVVAPVVAQ